MSYTFAYHCEECSDDPIKEMTVKVQDDITHVELLEAFERFVRGCGFILGDKNHFELISEEELTSFDEKYSEQMLNEHLDSLADEMLKDQDIDNTDLF